MKNVFFIFLLIFLTGGSAFAELPPKNEAEFLYSNPKIINDDFPVKLNHDNGHLYTKGYDNSFVRDDGVVIYKTPNGNVETTDGKIYFRFDNGNSYEQ